MSRAPITRGGVLSAMAEFDALGRAVFLDRYGFNGARDYFVVHEVDATTRSRLRRWLTDGHPVAMVGL